MKANVVIKTPVKNLKEQKEFEKLLEENKDSIAEYKFKKSQLYLLVIIDIIDPI